MEKSRRLSLKMAIAAGAVLASPRILSAQSDYTNAPQGDSVVLGVLAPQSGPFSDEGAELLRGFDLAVDHINGRGDGGMLAGLDGVQLSGSGILGKRIEWTSADAGDRTDRMRDSALRMIRVDGATALFGGVATGATAATQSLSAEAGVTFLPGPVHGQRFYDDHAYRFSTNGAVAMDSVVRHLQGDLRSGARIVALAADFSGGDFLADAVENAGNSLGLDVMERIRVPLASDNISSVVSLLQRAQTPDVIAICGLGFSMFNMITTVAQNGFADRARIVVPILDNLVLRGLGSQAEGIVGAMDWTPQTQDGASQDFVRSFGTSFGPVPGATAHNAYVQTILYADAVERAGTFRPEAVREAIEDHSVFGLGVGTAYLPRDTHEWQKGIFIGQATGRTRDRLAAIDIQEFCPSCGTNAPETCSQSACAQGYCCKKGKCVRC